MGRSQKLQQLLQTMVDQRPETTNRYGADGGRASCSQGLMGGRGDTAGGTPCSYYEYNCHATQSARPSSQPGLYADNTLPCNVMYTTKAVRITGSFHPMATSVCRGPRSTLQIETGFRLNADKTSISAVEMLDSMPERLSLA